jgi:hypothetical protein
MPATWAMWSKEVAGRILPFTEQNEHYVAVRMIKKWVDDGYTNRQISLTWNQGHTGACASGHNKHGIFYDSCAYASKVLAKIDTTHEQ